MNQNATQPRRRIYAGRHLIPRLAAGCATLALACSFAQGIGSGVALAKVPVTKVVSYGGFEVSGPVSGTLTPLAGTCDASNTAADVEFSWFGKVKTLKGVSAQSIVSMELDLKGSSYARAGTLKNTDGNPPFLTFGATVESGAAVSWQSTSGTYSTTKRGVSGSLDVVLDQADGKPGRLTIKGSWQDCRVGGNI
jgi:hypothetical protein